MRVSRMPIKTTVITAGIIVVLLLAGCLLLLVSGCPAGLLKIVFEQNPGRFDRPAMETIIAKIRNAGLQPSEEREFVLDKLSDPESFHLPKPLNPGEMMPSGTGAGRVWAAVSGDGHLKVVIETRDLGHAGEYGFAYSDVPLSPEHFGSEGNWYSVDVPGHLNQVTPEMKIDDHWWEVLNED
jgi:hypothetical protein